MKQLLIELVDGPYYHPDGHTVSAKNHVMLFSDNNVLFPNGMAWNMSEDLRRYLSDIEEKKEVVEQVSDDKNFILKLIAVTLNPEGYPQ